MRHGPLIEDYYLGEKDLEAYYYQRPYPAMAMQFDLSEVTKRARELEAHGYYRKPPMAGDRACFAAGSLDTIDEISVMATKRGLEGNISKDEVDNIVDAYVASEFADPWWIGFECRQHVHTVVAVLRYLESRGELPPKFYWGP